MSMLRPLILAAIGTALFMPNALALMPLLKPTVTNAVENGRASPFVGAWSVTLPTMEVTEPDTALATCALPVRIEAPNDTHILYLGPRETGADAAMELSLIDDGTFWAPIAGGPSYFAFWIDVDNFYLYDKVPQADADWGRPYVYRRCD